MNCQQLKMSLFDLSYDFLSFCHCKYIALSYTIFKLFDVEKHRDLEIYTLRDIHPAIYTRSVHLWNLQTRDYLLRLIVYISSFTYTQRALVKSF